MAASWERVSLASASDLAGKCRAPVSRLFLSSAIRLLHPRAVEPRSRQTGSGTEIPTIELSCVVWSKHVDSKYFDRPVKVMFGKPSRTGQSINPICPPSGAHSTTGSKLHAGSHAKSKMCLIATSRPYGGGGRAIGRREKTAERGQGGADAFKGDPASRRSCGDEMGAQ